MTGYPLTDFLTPEQFAALQDRLRDEVEAINEAEWQAMEAVQAQFEQARAEARRRVLLSVLVPVAPTVSGDSCPTPSTAPAKLPETVGELPALSTSPLCEWKGLPEGMLTPTQVQQVAGVPTGSWVLVKARGWIEAAGECLYNNQPCAYYTRESAEALKVRWANRASEVEQIRGKPVLDAMPEGCLTRQEAMQQCGVSSSVLDKATKAGKIVPIGVLRVHGARPLHWPLILQRSEVEALKSQPRGRKPRNVAKPAEEPTPAPSQELEPLPLYPAFTPSEEKQLARRFATYDIVPAPEQQAPRPKVEIPEAVIDLCEGQRYHAEEAARRMHPGGFWLLRRFVEGRAQYKAAKSWQSESAMGWDPLEWWQRNGLGRWESTPAEPGAVGFGNGTTTGPSKAALPGHKL